jgi:hypothetical protein
MDTINMWVSVANIVASIATIGALIAIALEIKNSRRAEDRSAFFDIAEKSNFLNENNKLLNAAGVYDEPIEDFEERFPPGTKEAVAMANIINFLETLGMAVHMGLMSKQNVIESFGDWTQIIWSDFEPLLKKRRKSGRDHDWAYMEWLALESNKLTADIGRNILSDVQKLRAEVDRR